MWTNGKINIQYRACGANGEVTGSCHHITIDLEDRKVQFVVDYGMVQDSTISMKELYKVNSENKNIDWEKVDFIILTHLHNDHSGLLPFAVASGFQGNIITTAPTAKLAHIIMSDGAFIMQKECLKYNKTVEGKKSPLYPIYGTRHVELAMERMRGYDFNKTIVIDENIEIVLKPNGHILGSASPYITIRQGEDVRRLLFSGDVSVGKQIAFTKTGKFDGLKVDYLWMEATYGDREQKKTKAIPIIKKMMEEVILNNKGTMLAPVFSMGRSTVFLREAFDIITHDERFKNIDVYFASPMACKANRIHFQKDSFSFMDSKWKKYKSMCDLPNFHFIEEYPDLEKAVLNNSKPKLIIASAGSLDAGYSNAVALKIMENSNNGILYCGYKFPRSLGERIWKTKKGEELKIGDKSYKRNCSLGVVNLSGHSDWTQLLDMILSMRHTKIKKVFLNHGNPDGLDFFKSKLKEKINGEIIITEKFESYKL